MSKRNTPVLLQRLIVPMGGFRLQGQGVQIPPENSQKYRVS